MPPSLGGSQFGAKEADWNHCDTSCYPSAPDGARLRNHASNCLPALAAETVSNKARLFPEARAFVRTQSADFVRYLTYCLPAFFVIMYITTCSGVASSSPSGLQRWRFLVYTVRSFVLRRFPDIFMT